MAAYIIKAAALGVRSRLRPVAATTQVTVAGPGAAAVGVRRQPHDYGRVTNIAACKGLPPIRLEVEGDRR